MESRIVYLNSNDDTGLIGFGKGQSLVLKSGDDIESIQSFIDEHKGTFIFMALSYDLKNHIEELSSNNQDTLDFPDAIFWAPDYVLGKTSKGVEFLKGSETDIDPAFIKQITDSQQSNFTLNKELKARISKEEYLRKVIDLKDQIQYGNIYEVNFCQEFYAQNIQLEQPLKLYHKLNGLTQTPFSCYFGFEEYHVMSGSPERFIKKSGSNLISQPIKGTIKRGKSNDEDLELIKQLKSDPKEQAENVMIVDLVRNDLSRIAKKGTVNVDELFGVYSFKTVHQMISTISCEIKDNTSFVDILKALFPMGSMTGAPKISAMKLIEEHEAFKRGIYSGSIGCIDPSGDFDLNVIIRSLVYNSKKEYLSCGVGGAITIQSDPNKEYEECHIKVNSILKGINE